MLHLSEPQKTNRSEICCGSEVCCLSQVGHLRFEPKAQRRRSEVCCGSEVRGWRSAITSSGACTSQQRSRCRKAHLLSFTGVKSATSPWTKKLYVSACPSSLFTCRAWARRRGALLTLGATWGGREHLREVLANKERTFGSNHPLTLATKERFAKWARAPRRGSSAPSGGGDGMHRGCLFGSTHM